MFWVSPLFNRPIFFLKISKRARSLYMGRTRLKTGHLALGLNSDEEKRGEPGFHTNLRCLSRYFL
ncbi:TPA: hypothetical protein DCX15_00030 [bacterium]|nr:hypothetical protein [bacterium]